ncbi:MAG: phosphatidate cytidylyltransferase [Candidatus Omnitrophota bacterium]
MNDVMLGRRFFSSIVLTFVVILAVFFLPGWFFSLIVTLLIAFGLHEFYTLIEKKGLLIYKYFGIFIGVLLPITIFLRFEPTKGWELFFITFVTFMLFIAQFARRDSSQAIVGISTTMFGIFYVSWFFSFLIKIKYLPYGGALVSFLLLVTKSGDIGAYFIGTKFGRHSLIPRISPSKSIEGTIGGLLCSVFAAAVSGIYLNQVPFVHLMTMGLGLGIIGQIGDLCESLIKRDCNVKDSGTSLPGMGGVLDLIDSLLFSTPIFYFYISHFNLS